MEQELNDLNIEVRINNQIRSVASASVAPITKLNLDVTAMMAYVSSLTCESFDYEFKHNVLNEQAAKEATASTKQFLDDLFKGTISIDSINFVLKSHHQIFFSL